MFESLTGWKSWALLALALAAAAALGLAETRRSQIIRLEADLEILRLESDGRLEEIARLKQAAAALDWAGRAQNIALSADIARREEIEKIMAGAVCEAAPPKGVIDEKSSRQAIELINLEFSGLRRP